MLGPDAGRRLRRPGQQREVAFEPTFLPPRSGETLTYDPFALIVIGSAWLRIPADLGGQSGVIWASVPAHLGARSERSDETGHLDVLKSPQVYAKLVEWLR